MISIDNYFRNRVNEMLSKCNEKTLFIFKGFSISQIKWLSQHPQSLLNDSDLFSGDNIDIKALNEKWLDMIQSLKISNYSQVGFYEELLAIHDFLPRIKMGKIIIIVNNFLTPWTPCYVPYEQSLSLFDFLQEDHDPESETIRLLSQYYGDVKFLDNEQSLLLPTVIEEDNITEIWFWQEEMVKCNTSIEYTIEVGTTSDWLYRLNLISGLASPVMLLQNGKSLDARTQGLASALSALGLAFDIDNLENYTEKPQYDATQFLPLLKKFWGSYAEFRPLLFYKDPDRSRETEVISQGQIISEIVDQCELALDNEPYQNIFITAPTGAGKSILFQLPAIYMAEKYKNVTIVVSPLIALMNDQVDQLQRERGISIAACINSTMTIDERIEVIDQIHSGEKSLLYLAPELLLTTHLQTFLGGRNIGLVVIDEAHTVTSWGRDFRSDYWFLGDFLKKAKRDGLVFPVLCLTATAVYSGENDVVDDTIQELGLDKTIIHLGNVKRDNISFDIVCHVGEQLSTRVETEKIKLTLKRMRKYIYDNEKVLTYFPYRSQVDLIHSQLDKSELIRIRRYHSHIPTQERKLVERNYKSGMAMGLVCTKAFGMGIDVGDIKHVVHFAPTGTLADYVQEIGRAARNPHIQGVAHIDYFPTDLRYVKALNGISEMRQYQLKEMLKKICALYNAKQRRNILISAETFEYLFKEDEVENRTKTGLMLLAKDLANKYSFPVLVVRPKAMLSKNFVNIPFEIQEIFLSKYGAYVTEQEGQTRRTAVSLSHGRESEIITYSTGNTYLVDMAEIWENFFPDHSFGMFKKSFFETDIVVKGKSHRISPRVRVEIRYKEDFNLVLLKTNKVVCAITEVFSKFKNADSKQFTLQMFESELNTLLEEKVIAHDKMSLLLDIFTETVNENADLSRMRSRLRVLRKRKQSNLDETIYFVSSSTYFRLPSFYAKMVEECRPESDLNVFFRFYPLIQGKAIEIMPLLRLLELLDLANYEIRGGEKAEVFIRINDPSKIQRLANSNYKNGVLQTIQVRHRSNQKLLAAFFTKELITDDRWKLIEEYFLGNEKFVSSVLNLPDKTSPELLTTAFAK